VDKPSGTGTSSIDVDALIDALKDAVKELLTRPEVIALLAINLSPLRVLTRPQVIALLGVSKTTFDRLEAKGLGPPKIMLADRRIGYVAADVKAWLDARREKQAA